MHRRIRFLLTFWPLCHLLLVAGIGCFLPAAPSVRTAAALAALYGLPPLLCRLLFLAFGKPVGTFPIDSRESQVWFVSCQLQILFVRFPFLEEALMMIPRAYSLWLRLWGARIGKVVSWAPQVKIMDRSYLEIGDFAVIGFGARFTSHFVNVGPSGAIELLLATPVVGARALMGGESGLAPGAQIAPGEMLPGTLNLAPNSIWKDGRRRSKVKPAAEAPTEAPTDTL